MGSAGQRERSYGVARGPLATQLANCSRTGRCYHPPPLVRCGTPPQGASRARTPRSRDDAPRDRGALRCPDRRRPLSPGHLPPAGHRPAPYRDRGTARGPSNRIGRPLRQTGGDRSRQGGVGPPLARHRAEDDRASPRGRAADAEPCPDGARGRHGDWLIRGRVPKAPLLGSARPGDDPAPRRAGARSGLRRCQARP